MKKLITVLFVILATCLAAQNWSPILVNEKMNYQHSDSAYISHTIWVDSVETNGDNMIYHLNRIVKDVPDNPEIVLRNQPQFLLKQMADQNLGYYVFSYPGEIVIKSLAGIGDGWVFNQQSFILAEVSSVAQEDVFGVLDSVKVIHLSDGNEIRLSKNFGILNFPDFDNGGFYELVGIQNTEYGESVPDFWDIFDFEVGDVFQYNGFESNIDFTVNWIKKITITAKEVEINSINYNFEGIYYGLGWNNPIPTDPFEVGYPITGNLNFTDSISHLVNSFPNQLHILPFSGSGDVFTSALLSKDEETNLISKDFGFHYNSNNEISGELYFELDENSEIMYKFMPPPTIGDPCGLKGIFYQEFLGEIYNVEGCFEYESNRFLEGYIKDGDTVGVITPDSLLLVGTLEPNKANHSVIVFPNPANKTVNFKFPSMGSNSPGTIEIMNLMGEVAIKEEVNGSEIITLDIGNLNSGIYFYSIKENGLVIQKDKLIIQ